MKKLLIAVAAAGLLLTAAACDDSAGSAQPAKHSKTHKASCHRITAKAHVQGTSRYLLTLKGVTQPVSVPKPAFKAVGVGDKYCAGT
jgi:hypothetical protein